MTPEEKEVFMSNVKLLQERYPKSNIHITGDIVNAIVPTEEGLRLKGFNIEGYNFLYCLNSLVELLSNKLR